MGNVASKDVAKGQVSKINNLNKLRGSHEKPLKFKLSQDEVEKALREENQAAKAESFKVLRNMTKVPIPATPKLSVDTSSSVITKAQMLC